MNVVLQECRRSRSEHRDSSPLLLVVGLVPLKSSSGKLIYPRVDLKDWCKSWRSCLTFLSLLLKCAARVWTCRSCTHAAVLSSTKQVMRHRALFWIPIWLKLNCQISRIIEDAFFARVAGGYLLYKILWYSKQGFISDCFFGTLRLISFPSD